MMEIPEGLVFAFLMGCDHPDMQLGTFFTIYEALYGCQEKSVPSATVSSTASSQGASETSPFALIAATPSARS